MFERFTKDAKEVVVEAQVAALERRDPAITARHLAIAMTGIEGLGDLFTRHGVTVAFLDSPPGPRSASTAENQEAEALKSIGIDLDSVRRAVEETFGEGALDVESRARRRRWPFGSKPSTGNGFRTPRPGPADRGSGPANRGSRPGVVHIPFSQGAKQTLEASLPAAVRLNSNQIRAEHVALGLFGCEDPDLPLLPESLRADVEQRLRGAA